MRIRSGRVLVPAAAALILTATLAACSSGSTSSSTTDSSKSIVIVAAENEYGDVAQQIGGSYVTVDSIMSNPNTDPHTFEASQSVAQEVSAADLVIQNGVGYDTFMSTIESAAPNSSRKVIDVQNLLGLPDSTPNPHLWYRADTMPAVANSLASDLAALEPSHASYFKAKAKTFISSLTPWYNAVAAFKKEYPGTPVATTEPVSDYMLEAAGADNLTPWTFQADIMNGVDPAPQTTAYQKSLFTGHKVKVFVYNQQVTDPLTDSLIDLAQANHIPVIGVYETMPEPGYNYQSWMMAEVSALREAIADGKSTQKL